MKLEYIVCGFLFAAVASPVVAQQSATANSGAMTGRIETVYVRESRNFFIEKKLLKRPSEKDLWAEVRVENPGHTEYVTELAKLPENVSIERGDLVEAVITEPAPQSSAQFARNNAGGLAPFPEVNRVTALLAKRDTLRAMLFGLNKRPKLQQETAFEALACVEKPTSLAYSSVAAQ
jgi:hypothetical protein